MTKILLKDFQIKQLGPQHVVEILALQERIFDSLTDKSTLRHNTPQMFEMCVQPPHYSLGVWYEGNLVGLAILYCPDMGEENLAKCLQGVDVNAETSANYKLVLVEPHCRGNGLQFHLGLLLEQQALIMGKTVMCCTVSPDNPYSRNNMLKLGYAYNRTLNKYGSIRDLYYKTL